MPASWQASLPVSSASAVKATMGVRVRLCLSSMALMVRAASIAVHPGHVDVGEQKVECRSSSIVSTAAAP